MKHNRKLLNSINWIFSLLAWFYMSSCGSEKNYITNWSYGDRHYERQIPGKYYGELPDRKAWGGGAPTAGELVYLHLHSNHSSAYITPMFELMGEWYMKNDTLVVDFSRQKTPSGMGSEPIPGQVDFDMEFILGEDSCLVPVNGRTEFCPG